MTATVLHLDGPVLVGPDDVRGQAWVVGGRLTFDRPSVAAAEVQTLRGWVLPGLVDAHCHVGLDAHGAVDRETAERQALGDREAGTLLIRDAGSPSDTRWIDDREDLPKIIRAGRHIARTRRYIRNYAHEVEPDQLVERVRLEARAGDGWVKLVGDWIDRDLGDLAPCWPLDVLKEAVAAAHEEGARVTAHCFGQESLHDFAAAGTDCVEHATGLEPATIEQFAAQGIAVVPTLVNIATFPAIAEPAREKFPDYHRRMIDLHARRYATVAAAHEAGIPVYVGTDAGGSLPHGLVAQEVAELVRAGLSPLQALGAGTWAARDWLGRPGLEEGAEADLVVLAEDPRRDVGVLAAPQRIVLRGRVVG
ncbi:MAG TPA: amidohydrolase family protein [Pedococcus sp.]|jgi:imidazolonepropionase-like amidohydrolase|uniref:amidohydrolase family protein n=1 Tax=Pedococcus sp. TaxID=2860345 RepID=UPI002F959DD0